MCRSRIPCAWVTGKDRSKGEPCTPALLGELSCEPWGFVDILDIGIIIVGEAGFQQGQIVMEEEPVMLGDSLDVVNLTLASMQEKAGKVFGFGDIRTSTNQGCVSTGSSPGSESWWTSCARRAS